MKRRLFSFLTMVLLLTPSAFASGEYLESTMDRVSDQVIGYTQVDLNGNRDPGLRTQETNLGDFAADSMLWYGQNKLNSQVSIAITNGGSLRRSILKGDILESTIDELCPFGNTVVTLDLTGKKLVETLEAATYALPEGHGSFPHVSGIEFTLNTDQPYVKGEIYQSKRGSYICTYYRAAKPGTRVQNVMIDGKPIEADKRYTIITNSYLALGGDTYYTFLEAEGTQKDIGVLQSTVLKDYLRDKLNGQVTAAQYGEVAGRVDIHGLEPVAVNDGDTVTVKFNHIPSAARTIAAAFDSHGKMLCYRSGRESRIYLHLPEKSEPLYVKVFFLNLDYTPAEPHIQKLIISPQ